MKKMASICLFIVTILSFLVTINLYQSKDYEQVMKMGQTTNSFNFYIQNSDMTPNEEISLFKHLSHKYDASFILTTTGQNGIIEKSVIASKNFPAKLFRLKKVKFNNQNNFYASYQTKDKNQLDTIPTFFSRSKVLLETLPRYYRNGKKNIDGVYTVLVSQHNKSRLLKDLSINLNQSTNKLLTPTKNFYVEYANNNLYGLILIAIVCVLVFILVNVYLPMSQINVIGIQKLNGWSNITVFNGLTKLGAITILTTSIILDVLSFIIFPYQPQGFILSCVLTQFAILVLFYLSNTFTYLLIRKMSIADLLHERYHFNLGVVVTYFLKILMAGTTTILLFTISTGLNSLLKEKNIQAEWNKEGSILTLNSISSSVNSNESEAEKTIYQWYKRLNKNKGVYYINSNTYTVRDVLPQKNSIISDFEQEKIDIMMVNNNFLEEKYPGLDKGDADFHVPIKLHNKKIKYVLQCIKYNELSDQKQKKIKPQSIPIKIKYYSQKITPITYNPSVKKVFHNPIFEIIKTKKMTQLEIMTLMNTGKNSSIKIENNINTKKLLKALNQDPKVKNLNPKFTTLNSLLAASVEDIQNGLHAFSIVLVLVIILNIFTTTFLIFCIVSDKQKELAVKRLLGYKRIDCYKYEFLFLLFLGIIETITLIILKANYIVITVMLLITVLDMLIFYLIAGFLESKKLSFLLKGGLQ